MPQLPRSLAVRRSRGAAGSVSAGAAVAVLAAVLLSGCVGGAGRPSPSAPVTPTPTATATTPAVIVFHPGGTAQQNLPFFDKVNRATLAAKPDALGRDFIDGLVAAGFTKTDMQVTVDTTTIGLKANSIQFSVRMGSQCLIGQNGADAGGYHSLVAPVLATDACLIGQTRPIDW
jgi:hypothetical protein